MVYSSTASLLLITIRLRNIRTKKSRKRSPRESNCGLVLRVCNGFKQKKGKTSVRLQRRKLAAPSSRRRGSARKRGWKRPPGSVVVLSAGGGGGGGGGGGCRSRELERRGGGGRGAPCLATISSSVAGSAGGCGPVVGLPSYKKRQGSGAAWGRGTRGRGRGRGGGANLLGSGVAPANYPQGLQGVGPGLREVVNILGERNQAGTLTGVGPPPGTLDSEGTGDEEEGTSTKRPPRPLYRRLINYVRQAWTGVKFALDSEYEEEQTPRYRPDSLASLCRATRFTEAELKRIYRGFKAECPTGVVREETFKCIYSQFFPQGANTSQYAHYVFNTLDQDHSGLLSFEHAHIRVFGISALTGIFISINITQIGLKRTTRLNKIRALYSWEITRKLFNSEIHLKVVTMDVGFRA
ncbi:Kv channel-interacting protein 4-like [Vespula squamosa]|uniref:Kv channel-interacting protein 4-like n=1 Tax=Vespula squamosa TaxID=30214 RepID=A0ABD2B2M4_VESSQ